jgi:hypothetical protein
MIRSVRSAAALTAGIWLAGCVRTQPTEQPTPYFRELAPVILASHDSVPAGTLLGTLVSDLPTVSMRDAIVELTDLGVATRVDSVGRFVFAGLPSGSHRLRVRRIGFEPTIGMIELPVGTGTIVRVHIEPVMTCLDYCTPQPRRAFGRIELVQ